MNLLGVDVGQEEFHVYDGTYSRHKRQGASIRQWVATLAKDTVVGLEPTGRLHRELTHALLDAGLAVYMLNPYKVKRYHDSSEYRVKTDKVDARVARDYLRNALEPDKKPLHPYSEIKRAGEPLKDLLEYREGLVDRLASQRRSHADLGKKKGISLSGLEREFKQAIAAIDRQIAEIAGKKPGYSRLLKADGIGPVSAGVLTWMLSSHQLSSRHSAVCFAGMDVRIRESGKFKGKSKLSKQGPPIVRRSLFMAANSLRRIPEWRPFFEYHESKGRSKVDTTVRAAKKLLRIAYALWECDLDYDRATATRFR